MAFFDTTSVSTESSPTSGSGQNTNTAASISVGAIGKKGAFKNNLVSYSPISFGYGDRALELQLDTNRSPGNLPSPTSLQGATGLDLSNPKILYVIAAILVVWFLINKK